MCVHRQVAIMSLDALRCGAIGFVVVFCALWMALTAKTLGNGSNPTLTSTGKSTSFPLARGGARGFVYLKTHKVTCLYCTTIFLHPGARPCYKRVTCMLHACHTCATCLLPTCRNSLLTTH